MQVLPLVLRWLMGLMRFEWVIIITALIGATTALFGLLLRPIDPRALALLDEQQKQQQQQLQQRRQQQQEQPLPTDEEKAREGIVRFTIDKHAAGQQQQQQTQQQQQEEEEQEAGVSAFAAAAASIASAAAAGAKRMSPMRRASMAPRMRHNSASITSFDGFICIDKSLIAEAESVADAERNKSPVPLPHRKTAAPPSPSASPTHAAHAAIFRTQSETSEASGGGVVAPVAPLSALREDDAEQQTNGAAAASAATGPAAACSSISATEPTPPAAAIAKVEEQKGVARALAAGCDYLRAMPPLLCNVPFIVHALCYAVQLGCAVTLVLSLDSFVKEIGGTAQLASYCMMSFAIGDLLGRVVTGIVSSLPAFFPQVVEPPADEPESSGRRIARVLLVTVLSPRAIYCASTWLVFFSILAIARFASTDVLTVTALYQMFAIGAGGETGQYAVVMVELVGVKRMAAAHALYTLLAGPIFAAGPALAGFIKDRSSYATAYTVLGIGYAIASLVDTFNLLVVVECSRRRQRRSIKKTPPPEKRGGGESVPLTK